MDKTTNHLSSCGDDISNGLFLTVASSIYDPLFALKFKLIKILYKKIFLYVGKNPRFLGGDPLVPNRDEDGHKNLFSDLDEDAK